LSKRITQLAQETPNKIKKTYVYEPLSFKPVALVQDNEVYHYHLDHLGTPRELTNNEGDIVWKVRYRTWGNVALKECEEIENNIRFQGQYFDEETGLHYNRHRYYNPDTGQFISQDPIGLLGGINNYQYAPNPLGWIDPYGLCKDDELGASVLSEENFLGKGAYKNAHIIDGDRVFLTPIANPAHGGAPATIEDLHHEAWMLDKLSQEGLSTLAIYGTAVVNMPDGSQVQGIIAERKLFNSKDVFDNIYKGTNPQGVTQDMVYDTITQDTVVELEKMRETIIKNNVEVNDFQIMYGKDGKPVIADPKDIGVGKDADEGEVEKTIRKIESEIIMIKDIADKKPMKIFY